MGNISPDTPQKQCSKCKQWKDATTQYFHRHRANSLYPQCKQCRSIKKPSDIESGFRRCSRCKKVFPASAQYFGHTNRTQEKYLTSACKTCESARRKALYQIRKEEHRERRKKYYQEHKVQMNAYNRRYRKTHWEPARVREKRYRQERREEILQYRREHNEALREYSKKYRQSDRGKATSKASWHRRRILERDAKGNYTSQQLYEQLQRQKLRCYYCHVKLDKVWHADHVVPLSRGGTNDISNIVVACQPCNNRKHNKLLHEWNESGHLL